MQMVSASQMSNFLPSSVTHQSQMNELKDSHHPMSSQDPSFTNLIQLAQTSAVNSLLPAVLRHKNQQNNSNSNSVSGQLSASGLSINSIGGGNIGSNQQHHENPLGFHAFHSLVEACVMQPMAPQTQQQMSQQSQQV